MTSIAASATRTRHVPERRASVTAKSTMQEATKEWKIGPDALESRFENRLRFLKIFHKEHGNFNVPLDYVCPAGKLGSWVSQLRNGRLQLPKHQHDRLAQIGFDFASHAERLDQQWMTRFYDIVEACRKNPKLENAVHGGLSIELRRWVSKQRTHYRKNLLDAKRIQRLDSIGFNWDANTSPKIIRFKKKFDLFCKQGLDDSLVNVSGKKTQENKQDNDIDNDTATTTANSNDKSEHGKNKNNNKKKRAWKEDDNDSRSMGTEETESLTDVSVLEKDHDSVSSSNKRRRTSRRLKKRGPSAPAVVNKSAVACDDETPVLLLGNDRPKDDITIENSSQGSVWGGALLEAARSWKAGGNKSMAKTSPCALSSPKMPGMAMAHQGSSVSPTSVMDFPPSSPDNAKYCYVRQQQQQVQDFGHLDLRCQPMTYY